MTDEVPPLRHLAEPGGGLTPEVAARGDWAPFVRHNAIMAGIGRRDAERR